MAVLIRLVVLSLLVILVVSQTIVQQCGTDPNKKVIITETAIDGDLYDMQWIGHDYQTVFVVTNTWTLYRSNNGGKTWSNEMKLLNPNGHPYVFAIFPTPDLQSVYILGKNTAQEPWGASIWIGSVSTGTYHRVVSNPPVAYFELHPTDSFKAMAMTYFSDRSTQGFIYGLKVTKDRGTTFTDIAQRVSQFEWGVGDIIWYTAWPNGTIPWSNWYEQQLFKTKDWGLTKEMVMDHAAGMALRDDVLFIAEALNRDGKLQLLSSKNRGQDPFVKAEFPIEVDENRYTLLDVTYGSMFINVQLSDTTWGHVFASDSLERKFILSLERNKREPSGHCDFIKFNGLDGIYLANHYVDGNVKSVMSFDNGGEWRSIQPPAVDSKNQPISCTAKDCALHLHMNHKTPSESDEPFGPIHTRQSAIGLILATGNIGDYLLDGKNDEVNTYFSNNGGWTWYEVQKGSHVYEFGDHGAITILANNIIPTDTLIYSWNEGKTWTQCKFTNGTKVEVDDIVVEPMATSQSFILYGSRSPNGVLIHLDFSQLHERSCIEEDYEEWSPTDIFNGDCLLGKKVVYTRRKREAECYNPLNYERVKTEKICPCAQVDYECDYCFEASEDTPDLCLPVCNDNETYTPTNPPNPCVGYFNVTRGYRLVPGDVCDIKQGLGLLPYTMECPTPTGSGSGSTVTSGSGSGSMSGSASGSTSGSAASTDDTNRSHAAVIVVVLVGMIVGLVAGATWLWRHERARRWVSDKVEWGRYRVLGGQGGVAGGMEDDEDVFGNDAPVLNDDSIVNFMQDSPPVSGSNNTSSV